MESEAPQQLGPWSQLPFKQSKENFGSCPGHGLRERGASPSYLLLGCAFHWNLLPGEPLIYFLKVVSLNSGMMGANLFFYKNGTRLDFTLNS